MNTLTGEIKFDDSGLLLNPDNWTPELALRLAEQHGIEQLTESHWAFIHRLRDYYLRFHVPPPADRICRSLQLTHGCGHRLFHNCLEAWQIAGLPDPGEEAKSYLSAE